MGGLFGDFPESVISVERPLGDAVPQLHKSRNRFMTINPPPASPHIYIIMIKHDNVCEVVGREFDRKEQGSACKRVPSEPTVSKDPKCRSTDG